MGDKLPWMKLWFDDLDRDCGALSLATRGAWVWILGDLRNKDGERTLTLEGWARVVRASIPETAAALLELIEGNICDHKCNASVTEALRCNAVSQNSNALITIRNRRIFRESKERDLNNLRQKRYRSKHATKEACNAEITLIEAEATEATEAYKDIRAPKSAAISLPSVEAYQLSEKLRKAIQVRDPNAKAALLPDLTPWSRDIDKLLRIDKRKVEDVLLVIEWCQKPGCFWGPVILSGRKLRDKFDTLYGQMTNGGNANGTNRQSAQTGFGPEFNPGDLPDYARK